MASKDNLIQFIRKNELGVLKKRNRKKIYSYIYPNKVYSNVKIPDCFFKKFTTDGKVLIFLIIIIIIIIIIIYYN